MKLLEALLIYIFLFLIFIWGCLFSLIVERDIQEAALQGDAYPSYCMETKELVNCGRVGKKLTYRQTMRHNSDMQMQVNWLEKLEEAMRHIYILFFMTFALQGAASAAEDTYRVYDKDWNVEEYWKEKDGTFEIFNKDWSRKGYIRKEGDRIERYDKNWGREGAVRKEEGPALPRR